MESDRITGRQPSPMSRRRMTRLRRWILFAWSVTILGLAGVFVASMLLFRYDHCRGESSRAFARLLPLVEERLQQAAALLYGELEELAEEDRLRQAMRARDYEGFCKQAVPIQRRMEKRYHLRSLGVLDLQGRRMVRVPPLPGRLRGQQTPQVMPIAQDGQWHVRRSADNDLVISVVHLWRIDGEPVGYLEATTRMKTLMRDLERASGISVDALEPMEFRSSQSATARRAGVAGGNVEELDVGEEMILAYVPLVSKMLPGEVVRRTHDGRVFHVATCPIQNASRQDALQLILYQDVTEARVSFRNAILVGLAVCAGFGLPLGIGFFLLWSRLDRASLREYQSLRSGAEELQREMDRHLDRDRQLRQDRELIHDVLANIPVFAFWKDSQGRYQGGNIKYARLVGMDDWEDLVGKTDQELRWSETRTQEIQRSDRQVLDSGIPILNREEVLHWPDGRDIYVLTSKVPLRDENGTIRGLLGIHTDVTNRRRAEDELRCRLSELRQFEAMSIGREHRMIQLKREVNELLFRLGAEPRYDIQFTESNSEEEPVS